MVCIINILNNTFIGTLLAGILIALFGFWLYGRQKKVDIIFEDIRRLRDNASALFAALETASVSIEGLFNIYGDSPHFPEPLRKLGKSFGDVLLKKMEDDFSKISKDINSFTEELLTKIKIKNIFNVDPQLIRNISAVLNVYLHGAFTLKKLTSLEVEGWRTGWNEKKATIQAELNKILA